MISRLLTAAAITAAVAVSPQASAATGQVTLRTLSTRADLVTGGDARIAVALPAGQQLSRLTLNGKDVTAVLHGRLQGVVTGLHVGRNLLTATTRSGHGARLVITDHPVGGPLFAGPQVQPWACTTAANGLGAPADKQCNARSSLVSYQYKSAVTGRFDSYDPAAPPAAGLIATTTTDQGKLVPYVVKVTKGTLDRTIYDSAVLVDAWNGKLYVPFGGACSAKHSQTQPAGIEVAESAPDGAVLLDHQLKLGWAVATSGLNVLAQDCNPTVSAEALTILKEHVGDELGPIRWTIGAGCSGGSVQVNHIADAYPGLLDAIIPSCSFPDLWTPITEVADCLLLDAYMDTTSPHLWADPAQRAAVVGHATGATCPTFATAFGGVLDPSNNDAPVTACDVPQEQLYDPAANPRGVRCTVQDYNVAVWGRRANGFAGRPLDNVGVQYGLQALTGGAILPEQFVDLNGKVGGLDIDGHVVPGRMVADAQTVQTAYRADQITRGRNLSGVPVIDLRGTGNAEIHTDYHSYSMRARLRAANGDAGNEVIWTTATDDFVTEGREPPGGQLDHAFDVLDSWLTRIGADHRPGTLPAKVRRDRPSAAVDTCFVGSLAITDSSHCATLYPHYGNPRIAAGGPLANDVMQCALTPLRRTGYAVAFTDDQWSRLQAAFPHGVCDWKAVARRPAPLTWPTFAEGPGGQPLGSAPRSTGY